MIIRPSFGTQSPRRQDYEYDLRLKLAEVRSPTPLAATEAIILDERLRNLWPARDQYGRGTCVAFAVVAAIELLRAREAELEPERLSEQFLHHMMQTEFPLSEADVQGMPKGGSLLRQAWQVLERFGIVDGDSMPYRPAAHGTSRGGPKPTQQVLSAALENKFTCLSYGRIGVAAEGDDPRANFFASGRDTAEKLLQYLQNGYPVAIGLPLFTHCSGATNWTLPDALTTGRILCPEDPDGVGLEGQRNDGHVVCLTGFVPDPLEKLGGWFTFRNSWGNDFATRALGDELPQSAICRGNGLLSATHVNEHCWEYLVPGPERRADDTC
jgi:hypothetical protein